MPYNVAITPNLERITVAAKLKPIRSAPAPAPMQMRPYPPHQGYRGGCKVSWYTYTDAGDAKAASDAARYNGEIQESRGYDFGYQVPGHTTKVPGGFEVVIP